MKSKKITLSKLLLGVSSLGVLLAFGLSSNTSHYEPRKENNSTSGKERTGALASAYYFNMRKNAITGDIPYEAMVAARNSAKEMENTRAGSLGLSWSELGPDNVGGRTRCFLIDNRDATGKTLFAGGVNGGLWKSINGGATWNLISDQWDNIAAVSICQEPGGKIYVGTGEFLLAVRGTPGTGNSSCIGSGIWESTDGNSFNQIPGTDPAVSNPFNNLYNQAFSYVYSLAYANGKLYAGTSKGIRISTDGGANWVNPLGALQQACKDVEAGNDGTIYASISNKMYVSSDGATFTVKTLPSAANGMTNLQIATSHSDENYVYCIGAKPTSYSVAGVWKSTDKGNTFTLIPNSTGGTVFQILGNQGDYACAIGVDPSNKDRIICGGLDLWSYSPSAGWNQISAWNYAPFNQYYNHADHHQIVFDKNHPNIVYFTNDGGVFKSSDGGQTFAATNRNFSVTQFYSVATSIRGEVLGGAQDNGTNLIDFNGPTTHWASEVMGGDGFDCDFSAINPDASFASLYFGDLKRSGTLGGSYASFFKGAPTGFVENSSFHTVIRLWESFNNQNSEDVVNYIIPAGQTIQPNSQFTAYSNNSNYPFTATYTGAAPATTGDTIKNIKDIISSRMAVGMVNGSSIRVFLAVRPLNFSDSPYWMPIGVNGTVGTNDGLEGEVSSLAFSQDGNHLYVGTQLGGTGGAVFRISNLNSIKFNTLADTITGWINRPGSTLTCTKIARFTGQCVTSVSVDPNNANKVVVTLGNYDNNNYVYRCDDATTATTANNSSNFTNIQGNLPKMPVYSSLIDYSNGDRIILGTEYGIFTSSNNGGTWTRDNDGMANCAVFMLRQQTHPYNKCWNSGFIYAATHGRGIFRTTTLTGVKEINNIESQADQLLIYPNPVFEQATLKFSLPEAANTNLTIYDLQGKVIKNINIGMLKKGTNVYTFQNDGFNEGTYLASINAGSYMKVVKFVVKN
jgi:hypothetical protein